MDEKFEVLPRPFRRFTKNKNQQQNLTSHLILSTARRIITHAKSYDFSTMSVLSVVRYFLLLNQLRAGDMFTSYSSDMKEFIFDKLCWSAGTESCTCT